MGLFPKVLQTDCSKAVCDECGGNVVVVSSSGVRARRTYLVNRKTCVLGQDFSR